jgi:hypothetical protein
LLTLTGTDNVGNTASVSTTVKVDTSAPTTPTLAFSGLSSSAFYSSGQNTFYMRPASGGTFTVTASSSDPETTITGYTFNSLNTNGGSNFGGSQSGNAFNYTFSGSTTAPTTPRTVFSTNGASVNSANASYSIVSDTSSPTSGAFSANGTAASAGGSSSYLTSGTTLTINSRTDYSETQSATASGLASSTLTIQSATLSNNVCGSYGASSTISGTTSQTVSSGNCYLLTLTGTDNVGNTASVSTTVMVDTSAPTTPSLSFTGLSSNAFYSTGQNTLYFRQAAGGTYTVTASSSDPETAIKSGNAGYTFSSLSSNNFTGTQTAGQNAYTFGASATQPGSDPTVLSTNNANVNSSNASYRLKVDNTAPTSGAFSANGMAASAGGSTSSTTSTGFAINSRTDYSEAQSATASGLASSTLTIQSATLTAGTCGAAGSGGPYTTAATITGTTNPAITAGFCYVYKLTGTDNVGNATSITTTVTVFTSPTVTSTSPSSRGQGFTGNITINGTGFVSGSGLAASFSGTGVTVNSTTFNSATSLTVNITVASGATTGARNVTVMNPDGGAATGTSVFTVNTGPTVSSPTAGSPCNPGHNGTANCTITGTNFVSGATVTISANGTVNSVTFVSSTQITINVTGSGGNGAKGNITVTNPDGGTVTVTNGFSNG